MTKYIEIDMGHRVPNHKSKCKNIHGHRYKVEAGVDDEVVTTPGASNEGMVVDFSDIKQILMKEIDEVYDHGFVMHAGDIFFEYFERLKERHRQKIIFVTFVPTAENLAEHWFKILQPIFENRKIKLRYIKVWETPTSTAKYEEV